MKQFTLSTLFSLITLFSVAQDYPNIRIIQSLSSIHKELGDTTERGYAGNVAYYSQFEYDTDSLCVGQKILFQTNSVSWVDSLLVEMNFVLIGTTYFGETEEVYVLAKVDPTVIVMDNLSFVYLDVVVRYDEEEEKEAINDITNKKPN